MHRKQDEMGHQVQLFGLELQGILRRVEILSMQGLGTTCRSMDAFEEERFGNT